MKVLSLSLQAIYRAANADRPDDGYASPYRGRRSSGSNNNRQRQPSIDASVAAVNEEPTPIAARVDTAAAAAAAADCDDADASTAIINADGSDPDTAAAPNLDKEEEGTLSDVNMGGTEQGVTPRFVGNIPGASVASPLPPTNLDAKFQLDEYKALKQRVAELEKDLCHAEVVAGCYRAKKDDIDESLLDHVASVQKRHDDMREVVIRIQGKYTLLQEQYAQLTVQHSLSREEVDSLQTSLQNDMARLRNSYEEQLTWFKKELDFMYQQRDEDALLSDNMLETRMSGLQLSHNQELANSNHIIAGVSSRLEETQNELFKKRAMIEEAVGSEAELKRQHAAKLRQLGNEHAAAVRKMEEEHQGDVNQLTSTHATVIRQMEEEHQGVVNGLKGALDKEESTTKRLQLEQAASSSLNAQRTEGPLSVITTGPELSARLNDMKTMYSSHLPPSYGMNEVLLAKERGDDNIGRQLTDLIIPSSQHLEMRDDGRLLSSRGKVYKGQSVFSSSRTHANISAHFKRRIVSCHNRAHELSGYPEEINWNWEMIVEQGIWNDDVLNCWLRKQERFLWQNGKKWDDVLNEEKGSDGKQEMCHDIAWTVLITWLGREPTEEEYLLFIKQFTHPTILHLDSKSINKDEDLRSKYALEWSSLTATDGTSIDTFRYVEDQDTSEFKNTREALLQLKLARTLERESLDTLGSADVKRPLRQAVEVTVSEFDEDNQTTTNVTVSIDVVDKQYFSNEIVDGESATLEVSGDHPRNKIAVLNSAGKRCGCVHSAVSVELAQFMDNHDTEFNLSTEGTFVTSLVTTDGKEKEVRQYKVNRVIVHTEDNEDMIELVIGDLIALSGYKEQIPNLPKHIHHQAKIQQLIDRRRMVAEFAETFDAEEFEELMPSLEEVGYNLGEEEKCDDDRFDEYVDCVKALMRLLPALEDNWEGAHILDSVECSDEARKTVKSVFTRRFWEWCSQQRSAQKQQMYKDNPKVYRQRIEQLKEWGWWLLGDVDYNIEAKSTEGDTLAWYTIRSARTYVNPATRQLMAMPGATLDVYGVVPSTKYVSKVLGVDKKKVLKACDVGEHGGVVDFGGFVYGWDSNNGKKRVEITGCETEFRVSRWKEGDGAEGITALGMARLPAPTRYLPTELWDDENSKKNSAFSAQEIHQKRASAGLLVVNGL